MERKKRSKAWLHFTKKTNELATCNHCDAELSCKGGNTSNLLKHIEGIHNLKVRGSGECKLFDTWKQKASVSQTETEATTSSTCISDDDDSMSQASASSIDRGNTTSSSVTPFTIARLNAERSRLSEEDSDDITRKLTRMMVNCVLPFNLVNSEEFKEALKALNPKYKPFDRHKLSDTLIPAWYEIEKTNLISQLEQARKVAITADGWTAVTQDHYLTVTVHFLYEGKLMEKVLKTRAVYEAQTGHAVAEEIDEILEEFKIESKVVAATVDNAANMNVAVKKLQLLKFGCFAHTLNVAAQKIYSLLIVSNWAARIRAVVVWMKRCHMAKVVLKEKQTLLSLPCHMLILDVRTRWNSLYLMVERFFEQFPAIQASLMDKRIKKQAEKDRVNSFENADFKKAEEFLALMGVLYTSTLCVSSEKFPTCGQIIPILQKLEIHFSVSQEDSAFVMGIKQAISGDLSKRYQDRDVRSFLEESTLMDPRFRHKLDEDAIWERLRRKAVAGSTAEVEEQPLEETAREMEQEKLEETPAAKKKRKTHFLDELFPEDEEVLEQPMLRTIEEQVDHEVQVYKGLPRVSMGTNIATWWYAKKDTMPLLSNLAETYLCVQASSTPSERVFSCAGDTISEERSRLDPDKADMLIFLKNNC